MLTLTIAIAKQQAYLCRKKPLGKQEAAKALTTCRCHQLQAGTLAELVIHSLCL